MYNYCTLFDSNYLTRGLALYESLKFYSTDFHLYIFAFDNRSLDLLKKLSLEHATIIGLLEFEDEELLAVKPTRSIGEYCWTCTPSVIKYCLDNYDIDNCTYVDADIYFYSDPSILIEEMEDKSVLITEHRYTPKYDQSATSGIYCVQFMTFKRDKQAMHILNWWREACLLWCFNRFEDGKFGDQKYLDDWPERFEGIHVLVNLGGGVAPWNIQQYDLKSNSIELVFYHFHGLQFIKGDRVRLSSYDLTTEDINIIYKPYISHLNQIQARLNSEGEKYDYHGIMPNLKFNRKDILGFFKKIIKSRLFSYSLNSLLEK